MVYTNDAQSARQQEKDMATANNVKLTQEERKIIVNALDMLHTSLERSEKSAKGATIAEAFAKEAAKVANLQNRIASGELEL